MGRSVNYLNNAEYVIYFTSDFLNGIDEEGNFSETEAMMNWDNFIYNLKYEICKKLKSYSPCERWGNSETSIFLENNFAEIGISEYCGLYSLSIQIKEDEYSDYQERARRENLGKNHIWQVKKSLENALLNCGVNLLNRVGTFSNGNGVYEKA